MICTGYWMVVVGDPKECGTGGATETVWFVHFFEC
jgi:hypothetical protein